MDDEIRVNIRQEDGESKLWLVFPADDNGPGRAVVSRELTATEGLMAIFEKSEGTISRYMDREFPGCFSERSDVTLVYNNKSRSFRMLPRSEASIGSPG